MSLVDPVVTAGAIATLASLCALGKVTATQERLREPIGTLQIASSVPSGQTLQWLALGHNEAVADLVWLNALSFFGAYRALDTEASWLDPHIEAVTTLDPKFRMVYEWAGTVIMYGGQINNDTVMASNRFLEMGVERFPFDWVLRFMLGVNYAFELRPTSRAQAEEWQRLGVDHLAIAAGLPNAPATLRLTATSLLRRQAAWREQAQSVRDGYLSAAPANARSMRVNAENLLAPFEAAHLVTQREVVRALTADPTWGIGPPELLTLLLPEPTLLFQPADVAPPPLAETR